MQNATLTSNSVQRNLVIINWVGAKSVLLKNFTEFTAYLMCSLGKKASFTKSSFRRSISFEILHGDSSGIIYEFVISVIVGFVLLSAMD